MIKRYALLLPHVLIFLIALVAAEAPRPAEQLELIPAPKEVQLHTGRFRVRPTTRILVEFGHQAEDRIAAETLAEEIHDQSGLRISIRGEKSKTKQEPRAIVLARLQDERVKKFLASKGLKANSIGDQGYLLFSDASHLIVAANSGQGLFYGVQTLRQLLRADGHGLTCPAVSIRDWPSMEWRGVQDDIGRGPIPTEDFMKYQIRTLAAYKVNLFGLYVELVFDFASQPLVARKEAALTPQEINALVDYAKQLYVTIYREQQSFGHLHHMLKYEIYSDVAERPQRPRAHADERAVLRHHQSNVCRPGASFSRTFSARGGDETFEVGRGQTAARAREVELGRIYLEHMQKVSGVLQPDRKQLMFLGRHGCEVSATPQHLA
jgi:hexosaminidase